MTNHAIAGTLGTLLLAVAALGACSSNDADPASDEPTKSAEGVADPRVGGITYGLWDPELDDYRVWVAAEDGSDPRLLVDDRDGTHLRVVVDKAPLG
jgi:hypothetical protein